MDYTNIMPQSYVASSYVATSSSSKTITGSAANVADGNDSTYLRSYCRHGGDGSLTATLYSEHTWSYPITVYRARGKFRMGTYGGNYKDGDMRWRLYLKIGGTWTIVKDEYLNTYREGSNSWAYKDRTLDISSTWANVTGARAWCYGNAYSYEGDRQQLLDQYIYDLSIYRQQNTEILRIKTPSTIIGIGRNDLTSSHKLRIQKGGTVYGIPLVETGDPTASKVRVYDGSVVKALVKAD